MSISHRSDAAARAAPTVVADHEEVFPRRKRDQRSVGKNSSQTAEAVSVFCPAKEEMNGQGPVNGNVVRHPEIDQNETSLGPWEPSITGKMPHEEVTKLVCDFLFEQVVVRKDIGAGPAGGTAIGQGAILEIEAKLGQIIDRNRGERLRLPVLTECVISKDDSSIRTAFESSMTLVIISTFLVLNCDSLNTS